MISYKFNNKIIFNLEYFCHNCKIIFAIFEIIIESIKNLQNLCDYKSLIKFWKSLINLTIKRLNFNIHIEPKKKN